MIICRRCKSNLRNNTIIYGEQYENKTLGIWECKSCNYKNVMRINGDEELDKLRTRVQKVMIKAVRAKGEHNRKELSERYEKLKSLLNREEGKQIIVIEREINGGK